MWSSSWHAIASSTSSTSYLWPLQIHSLFYTVSRMWPFRLCNVEVAIWSTSNYDNTSWSCLYCLVRPYNSESEIKLLSRLLYTRTSFLIFISLGWSLTVVWQHFSWTILLYSSALLITTSETVTPKCLYLLHAFFDASKSVYSHILWRGVQSFFYI